MKKFIKLTILFVIYFLLSTCYIKTENENIARPSDNHKLVSTQFSQVIKPSNKQLASKNTATATTTSPLSLNTNKIEYLIFNKWIYIVIIGFTVIWLLVCLISKESPPPPPPPKPSKTITEIIKRLSPNSHYIDGTLEDLIDIIVLLDLQHTSYLVLINKLISFYPENLNTVNQIFLILFCFMYS